MVASRKTRWKKTLGALAIVSGLSVSLFLSAVQAATPDSSPGTAIAIMQASAAIQSDDCASARAPLNLLWNDPYLDNSDPELAAQFRAALIACTAQSDGIKAAIALSAENIKRPTATVAAFDMHVFLLLIDQQVPAAARVLNDTLTRFPDKAADLTDLSVMGVALQIMNTDKPQYVTLLNRLEDVHWQPHNPAMRPAMDILRMEVLRTALAAGDGGHAALYRADIARDSLVYAISQGDGELSDGAVPAMDVRPVIAAEIKDAQAYVVENPGQLTVLNYLMMLERSIDQKDVALVQLNGIVDLVDQYGIENFQDIESYPELLAVRMSLLADLGRRTEADAAYADGEKRLTPLGEVDLNLAYMNYLTDRGEETAALALESKLEGVELTQGQQVQLVTVKACAYAYQGDEPRYAMVMASLANLPMSRVKPALCAGDTEGAAEALIAGINDPDGRIDAITFLQSGLAPIPYSERDKVYIARLQALKGRPDVIAAAQAAHINIRMWPLRF